MAEQYLYSATPESTYEYTPERTCEGRCEQTGKAEDREDTRCLQSDSGKDGWQIGTPEHRMFPPGINKSCVWGSL